MMIVCMFICVLMLFGTSLIVNSFLDECVPVKKLKMSIVSGTLLVVLSVLMLVVIAFFKNSIFSKQIIKILGL